MIWCRWFRGYWLCLGLLVVVFCRTIGITPAVANGGGQTFSYPLPPYTYVSEGADGREITGPLTELVGELARAGGFPERPVSTPVARLLVEVEHGNGIGFPLARNPEREPHFEWIVELYRDSFGFATLTAEAGGTGLRIDTLDDARRLERITVNRDSAPFNFLTAAHGFTNLDISNSELQNALKLFGNRTQAWFSVRSGFRPIARLHGFAPDQLLIGAPVQEITAWLIGPRGMAPATLAAIRQRFAQLKASGDYDRILSTAQ